MCITRSLGDQYGKQTEPNVILSIPEYPFYIIFNFNSAIISCHEFPEKGSYLIIASDGVWDVISEKVFHNLN